MKTTTTLRSNKILLLIIASLLLACNAQIPQKTKALYLGYHDLTARYNGYFNAKLILSTALKEKISDYQDNYSEILPLSVEESVSLSESGAELDRAIKKASVAIRLHGNSKWTDDCYFILGKARYYKGEYDEAVKTFQVITSDFAKDIRIHPARKKHKKKKKKHHKTDEENPYYDASLSYFKHKPVKWQAMIWMARSYISAKAYNEAQTVLTYANSDNIFPDKLKKDLYETSTELFIGEKNYTAAITSLQKTINNSTDKEELTRYHFILAQLQDRAGTKQLAIQSYRAVLEMLPGYEMEFYTRLNIADLSRQTNAASIDDILSMLNDMLHSEKYTEFKGQIYYSMAELYLSNKAFNTAIENFHLAIQHSEDRPGIKAMAYKELANLYFEQDKYVIAQAYHDSTLATLKKTDEDYVKISDRNIILKSMVQQLHIIEFEDSLQQLAALSSEEREAIFEKIKKETGTETENNEQENNGFENNISISSSNWPFDNVESKSRGFSVFRSRWGNRQLEDNWRRSDKTSSVFSNTETNNPNNNNQNISNNTTAEEYFANLPLSDSAMQVSNDRMAAAYYELASIYRDKLNNSKKASQTLETLIEKIPDNRYLLQAYYGLYLFYKDHNPAKAKIYQQKILQEFPESLFAKLIINPAYADQSKKEKEKIESYYAETYRAFTENRYNDVFQRASEADSLFDPNTMKAQYDMLIALCYGKQKKMDEFKNALEDIVNQYPGSDIQSHALEILNAIEGSDYFNANIDNEKLDPYKIEPNAEYYLIVLFYQIDETAEQVKNKLADYNSQNHSLDNLKISAILLNDTQQMVLVKSFDGSEKALKYYNEIRYNQTVFKNIDATTYTVFFSSVNNFGVFFREKDIHAYLKFFSKNYLKTEE